VLRKAEFEQFFDRLMSDTQRRAARREELAEASRAEALAKLMKSAPGGKHAAQRPGSAKAKA
jgi:hypothetical protein